MSLADSQRHMGLILPVILIAWRTALAHHAISAARGTPFQKIMRQQDDADSDRRQTQA